MMAKFVKLLSLCLSMPLLSAALVGTAEKMVIDGKLDEKAWESAPLNSGFSTLTQLTKKNTPCAETSFRVLADKDNVYLGIRCEKKDMTKLCATMRGHCNESLWRDDLVEIFLAPTGLPDQYYQFAISAGNGRYQMFFGEHGNIRPDDYAPLYEHQVYHGKDFYSVEVKMPLDALYMTRAKFMSDTWLLNVGRQNRNPREWSSWTVLKSSFHDTDSFRKVGPFPRKAPRKDLYVRDVTARLASPKQGKLLVRVEANPAAAGSYELTVKAQGINTSPHQKVTLKAGENILELAEVTFAQEGKIKAEISLTATQDTFTTGRYVNIPVHFQPFTLDLTAPSYNHAFFPGQKADRLTGSLTVNVPADYVTITAQGKNTKLKVAQGKASFNLPLNKLLPGNTIPVTFTLCKGSTVVGKHDITVRHIKPTGRRMVWIDADGKLVVDGKRIFALSWYGSNTWITSNWLYEQYPKMDSKQPNNFQSQVNLEPERLIRGTEKKEACRDVKPCQAIFDAVRKRIEQNRNRDFHFYYLVDEPECRGVSPVYLKYLYDYVKELDPTHPVMIISRSPGRYVDCADILNPHSYISPSVDDDGKRTLGTDVDSFRRICREIAATGRKNKVIMITPQVHSYNFIQRQADYPTFEETAASVWSSVCHGAQGISPYIWYAQFGRPSTNFGCDFVFSSLNRLMPLLVTSTKAPALTPTNAQIDTRCMTDGKRHLIAIVNVNPQKQTTRLSWDAKDADTAQTIMGVKTWQVFRENRTLTIPADGLNMTLNPYQVLLLTSEEMDFDLEPLDACNARIAMAEQKRRNRGNILFGRHRDVEVSHAYCRYMYQTHMEQQDCMFDGIINSISWLPHMYKELWYEMSFPKFVPKFSRIRIYGNGLEGMKLLIWKFGEWKEFPARITQGKWYRLYDFGKTLSTVKVRMEFLKPKAGKENRLELYEFEMLK